jgi:hypothetical protein
VHPVASVYNKTRQSRYLTRNYLFTWYTRLIFTTFSGYVILLKFIIETLYCWLLYKVYNTLNELGQSEVKWSEVNWEVLSFVEVVVGKKHNPTKICGSTFIHCISISAAADNWLSITYGLSITIGIKLSTLSKSWLGMSGHATSYISFCSYNHWSLFLSLSTVCFTLFYYCSFTVAVTSDSAWSRRHAVGKEDTAVGALWSRTRWSPSRMLMKTRSRKTATVVGAEYREDCGRARCLVLARGGEEWSLRPARDVASWIGSRETVVVTSAGIGSPVDCAVPRSFSWIRGVCCSLTILLLLGPTPRTSERTNVDFQGQGQGYITTNNQSVSMSWYRAQSWTIDQSLLSPWNFI